MQGTLIILDSSGHTEVAWDTEVQNGPLDPAVAEEKFNQMVKNGMFAIGTDVAGEHELIKKFDPETYPEIKMSPQIAGG